MLFVVIDESGGNVEFELFVGKGKPEAVVGGIGANDGTLVSSDADAVVGVAVLGVGAGVGLDVTGGHGSTCNSQVHLARLFDEQSMQLVSLSFTCSCKKLHRDLEPKLNVKRESYHVAETRPVSGLFPLRKLNVKSLDLGLSNRRQESFAYIS